MGVNFLIIWSLCINGPIIRIWKYMPSMLLALVFPNLSIALSYIKKLTPHPRIIDATTNAVTAKEQLISARSDGIFLFVKYTNRSQKYQTVIDTVCTASVLGSLDGKPVYASVFLVFIKAVPDDFRDRVYEIHIDGDSPTNGSELTSLIPTCGQLALVEDKIRCIADQEDKVNPLSAAVAFLYPKFAESSRITEYEDLLKKSIELDDMAYMYREADGVVGLVVTQLERYIEGGRAVVYEVDELKNIQKADIDFEKCFFVKGDNLFLHRKLFNEIVAPIREAIPVNIIKSALLKAGVLSAESESSAEDGYTARMFYIDHNNKAQRPRMMCFVISAIEEDSANMLRCYLNTYKVI